MSAEKKNTKIDVIYSDTCPDCPPVKEAIENVLQDFEGIEVEYREARDSSNLISKHDITHVPTVIINDEVEFVETLTEDKLRHRLEEIINE